MNRQRILLVDDEPDAIEFLQDLLHDHGYATSSASNAQDGLDRAREQPPDLVCLDVLMPKESGISLYQKLRTDPTLCRIPIVITSGLSFSRELKQIEYRKLANGTVLPEPDGIVEKPVDVEAFMSIIRRVLP